MEVLFEGEIEGVQYRIIENESGIIINKNRGCDSLQNDVFIVIKELIKRSQCSVCQEPRIDKCQTCYDVFREPQPQHETRLMK